jgi:hypothetical protein
VQDDTYGGEVMNIKIDKQYDAPWKVMKAASEGKRVATRYTTRPSRTNEWTEQLSRSFNFVNFEYAIIDESQPAIDWDGFDWEFFEPYGGVCIYNTEGGGYRKKKVLVTAAGLFCELRESPLYPWTGGVCPVPSNAEIEVIYRIGRGGSGGPVKAKAIRWSHGGGDDSYDIIAFRLTGKVL